MHFGSLSLTLAPFSAMFFSGRDFREKNDQIFHPKGSVSLRPMSTWCISNHFSLRKKKPFFPKKKVRPKRSPTFSNPTKKPRLERAIKPGVFSKVPQLVSWIEGPSTQLGWLWGFLFFFRCQQNLDISKAVNFLGCSFLDVFFLFLLIGLYHRIHHHHSPPFWENIFLTFYKHRGHAQIPGFRVSFAGKTHPP